MTASEDAIGQHAAMSRHSTRIIGSSAFRLADLEKETSVSEGEIAR